MRRTMLFVFAASVLSASAASADIPLPKNIRYVDPPVRFEGIEKYPNHVFHLRYKTFVGGPGRVPYSMVEVKSSNVLKLNFKRRILDLHLLALDRKTFAKKAKDDPSLKWLTDKTEGVLRADVRRPPTTAPIKIKEVPVTTYRVSLKDGKLTAQVVADKRRSEAGPAGPLPMWAFGIVGAVSLAWGGVWFARRRGPALDRPS